MSRERPDRLLTSAATLNVKDAGSSGPAAACWYSAVSLPGMSLLLEHLKECLGMGAGRAGGQGFRAFVDVAAVHTPPLHALAPLEHAAILNALQQTPVTPLVLFLGHGNLLEGDGNGRKTFLSDLS